MDFTLFDLYFFLENCCSRKSKERNRDHFNRFYSWYLKAPTYSQKYIIPRECLAYIQSSLDHFQQEAEYGYFSATEAFVKLFCKETKFNYPDEPPNARLLEFLMEHGQYNTQIGNILL